MHNGEGIFPWNKFDLRRKISRDGKLSPIQAGMLPESLLSPRSRVLLSVHFFKAAETSPENWLLLLSVRNVSEIEPNLPNAPDIGETSCNCSFHSIFRKVEFL